MRIMRIINDDDVFLFGKPLLTDDMSRGRPESSQLDRLTSVSGPRRASLNSTRGAYDRCTVSVRHNNQRNELQLVYLLHFNVICVWARKKISQVQTHRLRNDL